MLCANRRRSQNNKAHCVSSAANRCFDLTQCLGTIPRGDRQELLTLGAAAVYLVKPTRRVAGSADHRSARKNIVDERSGLAAVKQAGAPVSSQTNNHAPVYIDHCRHETGEGEITKFFKDSDLAQLYSTPNPRQSARRSQFPARNPIPCARLAIRSCGNVKSSFGY